MTLDSSPDRLINLPVDPLIGTLLDGRYRLDARLGAGGMGTVYRAHHLAMDRVVAVKLIQPSLARDATAVKRLLREAKGTFAVDSPYAVTVIDCALTSAGMPYVVLEYLDGRTVARDLDVDGPMAPARAVAIVLQVAKALVAAHRVGLIHRDLKPDNIMLVVVDDDPDVVKVLDFGLAKLIDDAPLRALSHAALTQHGVVFGTPAYMSPEQAVGGVLTQTSDLYALGVCLFEMLTGQVPFSATNPMEVLSHHVMTPAPQLGEVAAGLADQHELNQVVQRCLQKTAGDRYSSAGELIAALEALRRTVGQVPAPGSLRVVQPDTHSALLLPFAETVAQPQALLPSRRRRWLAVAALVGVVVAVVIGISTKQPRNPAAPPIKAHDQPLVSNDAAPPAPAFDAARLVDARVQVAVEPKRKVDAAPQIGPRPVDVHLANAEAARRSKRTLAQLAEADAALTLSPRNAHARYLIADALLTSGDHQRGCEQLRLAQAWPAARRALAQSACASD